MLSSVFSKLRENAVRVWKYFGLSGPPSPAARLGRAGMALSGVLMVGLGLWILAIEPLADWARILAVGLLGFGLFNLVSIFGRSLTLARANRLALLGHLTAVLSFYMIVSRVLIVGYTTDTVVGTYMAVLKALQLQSPYGISIKPLLDQFGFTPALYTPGVNGSFDFNIAYPSLSFLSALPFYVLGVKDLRDSIFIFHILSVLFIFALVPPKYKGISLAPFSLFAYVIAGGWTDSVWAFFLIFTAYFWYKRRKLSWISLGLAVASKQIAIVVAPFLLIRQWHESPTSNLRTLATSFGLMVTAFFLPNIPFIYASPSAWWKDVVAPFLPNSPPQVPGGIGLSNILLDLGIALPSSFYLVLMMGVSTFLFYAYARHYKALNSMVFAFPILLFFFYYRSFPNYMAYWLFPLVLELSCLGGPNLRILISARLPSLDWHLPTGTFLKTLRHRLTPSVMMLLAFTVAFVGVSGSYISDAAKPKATIQINGLMDPDNLGAATIISVTLKNLLPNAISPTFFVKWTQLPFYWISNSTSLLSSGSQKSYVLTAPDGLSAVPAGSQFRILIGDKLTGQLIGESSAWKSSVSTPSLANPGLRWWVLDETVGKRMPFGWKASLSNTDLSSSKITPLGFNGTSGAQMLLNYTSANTGLAKLALSQRVSLNATRVAIHFNESLTSPPIGRAAFGASIADGTHTLYYLFSDEASQETITTNATNTTVIMPAQASQWNTVAIDPQSIWTSQGWTLAAQVTLTIFIESLSTGIYYASVDGISPS